MEIEPMTWSRYTEIIRLTMIVRDMQKMYFHTRSKLTLKECKHQEGLLDDQIAAIRRERTATQMKLGGVE